MFRLRHTCIRFMPPHVINTSNVFSLHQQILIMIQVREKEKPLKGQMQTEKRNAYAGCQLWHWSPCRWGRPCWLPYRLSADPSRCWRAIGRACSQCFLSCHPGARSAKSEVKLSHVESNDAGRPVWMKWNRPANLYRVWGVGLMHQLAGTLDLKFQNQ